VNLQDVFECSRTFVEREARDVLKLLNSFKRVALRIAQIMAPLAIVGAAGVAAAADLQVSDYTWSPDPVANGAQTSFTIRVTNNGPGSVNDAVVTVAVPSHFSVQPGAFPAYCTLSGAAGSQALTCALPAQGRGSRPCRCDPVRG